MTAAPCTPPARLTSLSPENKDISLLQGPNQTTFLSDANKTPICKIYQNQHNQVFILNLSHSPIRVNDSFIQFKEEKELVHEDLIAFNQVKMNLDAPMEYAFCLPNPRPKNPLKRSRSECEQTFHQPQREQMKKLVKTDLQQKGLICSICQGVLYNCATVNPCQHSFCSGCLSDHLQNSTQCPLCKRNLSSLKANPAMQRLVDQEVAKCPFFKKLPEECKALDKKDLIKKGFNIMRDHDGLYVGFIYQGRKEGIGRMIYDNGKIYGGEWKEDLKEGFGICKWRDGDVYEGEWKRGRKHGYGVFENESSAYKGSWVNDRKDGKGIVIYNSGESYDGEWKEDLREGYGKYRWKNGDMYEGEWKQGKKHGYGVLENENSVYKGGWVDDRKDGKGAVILKKSSLKEGWGRKEPLKVVIGEREKRRTGAIVFEDEEVVSEKKGEERKLYEKLEGALQELRRIVGERSRRRLPNSLRETDVSDSQSSSSSLRRLINDI